MLLQTLVTGVAARWPDQPAVTDAGRSLTYAQLEETRARVAAAWVDAGLRPGDRVAILCQNCVELVVTYHAAFQAGLVAVPVNTRLAAPEISYILEHSGATALVVHARLAGQLPSDLGAIAADRVWVVGGDAPTFPALESFAGAAPGAGVDIQSPAAILYTSGTTSKPKGVTHSHASLWNTAANQAWTQECTKADTHLVSLSAAHIAGFAGQILTCAYVGAHAVMLANPSPADLLSAIEQYRPTYLQMTPAILAQTLDVVTSPEQLSSVRCCLSGGDQVPRSTHEHFATITGREVTEVCGMTETFSYLMNPPFGDKREGSIGIPTHGTRVRIVGEDGAECEPDVIGEIQVLSAATMVGYWNDPERTAAVLVDGWMHTGDMGRRDADGWFYFAARRTDLIICGGSNISPLEVEEVLTSHPAVSEAAVVGIPDPTLGNRVAARCVLHPGEHATADEILAFARERLAEYQTPERLEVVADLPHNATGKVDRRAVLAAMSAQGG